MTLSRRVFLSALLAAGAFPLLANRLAAMAPSGLKSTRGRVRVDGMTAMMGDVIKPGARVSTGSGGEAVLAVGKDAFLLRSNSEVVLPEAPVETEDEEEKGIAERTLTVVSGRILSVFGTGRLTIDAPLVTAGIRGTGAYVEVHSERTYVCLCYGKALMTPKLAPTLAEEQDFFHHDGPRNYYAHPEEHGGQVVSQAPMLDHTDEELIMLESLVGRIPLFGPEPIKM